MTVLGVLGLAMVAMAGPAMVAERPVTIFAFGDSLTAGYGVAPGAAFPVGLQAALKAKGLDVVVVNAGVSGDTTADGLARLDWSLPSEADAAIVEFGANDAFRGVRPEVMQDNLDKIVAALKAKGLSVLVAGMIAPRNMGEDYGTKFNAAFATVAARHGASLYPFFLDGAALDPALNQGDGIHPNARGVDVVVQRILPSVEALVATARSRRP